MVKHTPSSSLFDKITDINDKILEREKAIDQYVTANQTDSKKLLEIIRQAGLLSKNKICDADDCYEPATIKLVDKFPQPTVRDGKIMFSHTYYYCEKHLDMDNMAEGAETESFKINHA